VVNTITSSATGMANTYMVNTWAVNTNTNPLSYEFIFGMYRVYLFLSYLWKGGKGESPDGVYFSLLVSWYF
jgi:hypothetical protein